MITACFQLETWFLSLRHYNEGSIPALEKYLDVNREDLRASSATVRGDLKKLERKIMAALITIDVHARDIVEELWKAEVRRCRLTSG